MAYVRSLLVGFVTALLCACGGGADSSGFGKDDLRPAVPLPPDPDGEAAGLLDFGRVELGRSAVKVLYLQNDGDDDLLLEEQPPVGPFSATVPAAGLLLEPGVRVPLYVGFAPVSAGIADELLVLRSGDAELKLRLRGEGVSGPCVLSAEPLEFGEVAVGQVSLEYLAVRASGYGRCVLEDAIVAGAGFSPGSGLVRGVTLLPGGAALPVGVEFRPVQRGAYHGTLRLVAVESTIEVALTGTGR